MHNIVSALIHRLQCGADIQSSSVYNLLTVISHHHLTVHVGFFLLHTEIIHMLVFSNTEIIHYWSDPERAPHWHDCIAYVHMHACMLVWTDYLP